MTNSTCENCPKIMEKLNRIENALTTGLDGETGLLEQQKRNTEWIDTQKCKSNKIAWLVGSVFFTQSAGIVFFIVKSIIGKTL